ncbi:MULTISPECIES: cell division protein ZapC [unclassified Gilliamella]|uniref:cell division protein ZapC n=1 Tax=unclassified Gilliamella TaxID=2685620 RepID=UPI001C6A2207|nr:MULTISPECIES: cell division protein ZapC [unclassified Gilliamella]MCX8597193.1 cell division protein ZapC [Gilliamella sp. B3493]MCX8598827.1 cell division protein ZapC [Gilliamella sp. B3486]MCX8689164.1 cell division protein ZapC [Gilliamella sp. B2973]MCX8704867.1 cell division protein ZapC [Gilliamella sp. B3127]QYN41720.1 cell division protein ZapC [Gilliamella sp. ESL0443]
MKMAFRPTDSWRWYFDKEYDSLMLEISSEMLFRCNYASKILIPDVFDEFSFSVDDATAYYLFYDSCQSLALSDSQKIELSINAIVAANFIKPQMPKSWYFCQQPKLYRPKLADIVEVSMQEGDQRVFLLVVEAGENASLCIIAQPTFVAMNKTFYFSEAIKVMNDRLAPIQKNVMDESSLIDLKLEAIS